MQLHKDTFLQLIRLGIGNSRTARIPDNVDWSELEIFAAKQELSAILLDGLEKIPEDQRPPKSVLLRWIGDTLQGYEYRYELYSRAIAELAKFYNENGFKMMLIKGYACSLDWPKREHRPCGDIDIWLFGKQREADFALVKEKGIKINKSHHHHTIFYWKDFMVENHYDFVNVYAHKSSREMEIIFKELGYDDTSKIVVYGETVFMPSPNLHALFLLRHMASHFAAANINLRQVLDWAFFVKAHGKEVDWKWLVCLLEQYHMRDFLNCINAICVGDLGFPIHFFPTVQFEPGLKDRVLDDILEPAFTSGEPRRLVMRLLYKYKRWQGNEWKQKMCYGESRWSMFWSGIWAKMKRPVLK